MRRKWIISIYAVCFLLTGCSGLKNIQDINYIVGIGMDYDEEKDEFIASLQALNFANVAKQEGGKPAEPVPTFVASATGETLNLAVSKLYKKTEPPLFFGHVVTYVLSQRVVTHRFKEVIEEVGRNRSLRHTLRVVITEENIREIFNTKALFDYPAVYTVIYKKNGAELYQDALKPTILMNFLRDFYEPMGVSKIPIVKIDKQSWKTDKKYPVLFFNGFAIFQKQKFMHNLSFKDALYMNWLLEKKISIEEGVKDDGKLLAAVKLDSPKMKVKYKKGTTSPKFSIELSVKGDLLEKVEEVPLPKLKKLIEEDIKKKVNTLYKKGIKNETDLLNIGDKWYRKRPKKFHELKKNGIFYLDEDSLMNIKVKVEIFHFNSYKYYQRED